jgi:hypothetical protein
MFLYSPVPVLFPPRKKYYANLKQMMIVRQSTHHRTERRSSQLPPIHKIERRYSGRKNRARFQQTKFSTNASLCPSVCLCRLFSSAMYTCCKWRNTVLGLGLQTLNQYPRNNPGVQRFFSFFPNFRNMAREKKEKEGANVQR